MLVFKDLQNKKPEELEKLLAEKRSELKELQFKVQANELKNVRSVRALKREIAQILTAQAVRVK